jgi:hypothetical protein
VDFEPDGEEDEFSELTSANFPRVDLVGRPANGASGWLVMKQDAAAGVLEPDFVRDLIAKTATEEAPLPQAADAGETLLPNGITLKGSPAAMAAFIRAANVRKAEQAEPDDGAVAKAGMSAKSLNDLPDSAFAHIEPGGEKDAGGKTTPRSLRHFAIHDKAHADDAAARIAQGAKFGGKAKPKVEAAQRKFGEKKVSKEAGVPDAVTKDLMGAAGDATSLDDGIDGMDPTVPLAMPDDETGIPGDPTDPGSPAWEAIDAASAQKWVAIAARLKNALLLLAEREMLEAASADPSDAENAFDLQDAADAVDYAIGQLAVFASGERAEAEIGAETAEMCKALAAFDAEPLGVIEGLTAIAKAGRVLSASNEAKIRDAATALGDVLASLPSAPVAETVAKEKGAVMPATTAKAPAETVAKERTAEDQARDKGPGDTGGGDGSGEPREARPESAMPLQTAAHGDIPDGKVVKAGRPVAVWDAGRRLVGYARPEAILGAIAKADGEGKVAQVAVYDAEGNLVGVADPADITPLANAKAPDPGGGAAPAPDAPAPADDTTPQPPAAAGIPADAVGKAAGEDVITVTADVLKSAIRDGAREALEAQGAASQEAVAKMAAGNGALAEELRVVKARLAKVEETPAAPGVFTNGQRPPGDGGRPLPAPGQLRGQDAGGQPVDVAKAAELKETLYNGSGPEQARAFHELEGLAISRLHQIRTGQHSPAAAF